MENSANILLLGKTGVGKSSFINYFLGKTVAKAGVGRPVTQEYFTPYEIEEGQYPIQIFDTKGLEAMDAYMQLDEIIEGVKKRNNSDDVLNWFHTIFYCVSMANPRFEDFEAAFIRKLRSEISQHIHIILTQCDADNSGTAIANMRRKIANEVGDMEGIQIFEVVSIHKKKRNGEVVEPRGREDISSSVFELLVKDIASKVSVDYAHALWHAWSDLIEQFFAEINAMIDEKVKLKTLWALIKDGDQASDDIDHYFDDKFSEIDVKIEKAEEDANAKLAKLLHPVGQLYASYYGVVSDSYVDLAQLTIGDSEDWIDGDWVNNIDDDDNVLRYFLPKLRKYVDLDLNYKGKKTLWDYGNTFGSAVDDFFHLKSNIKRMIKDLKRRMFEGLPSEAEIQTKASERIVKYLGL